MMNAVSTYLREDIQQPFSFTVSELPHSAKLDQNELPFDLPQDIKECITQTLINLSWNRYPQPAMYHDIKKQFSHVIGADPQHIFLSMGCDQLILGAYLLAGGKDRRALIFEPTYPMFAHAGKITQTGIDIIQLDPHQPVEPEFVKDKPHHVIFIVAPNNPTGLMPLSGTIEQALQNHALVFVDEAYFDFSQKTWIDLTYTYPNLIIARSTAKSCLAGVRLGYGIGHPDLISTLETILTAPYHLNHFQLAIAKEFKHIAPYLKDYTSFIIQERDRVEKEFVEKQIPFIKSQGNFILFKVHDAVQIYQKLSESGVRIRNLSNIRGLNDYLRVTIGTKEENDIFLKTLFHHLSV